MAADTCELRATRQKVKASAICFVLPSRLPLELGGEGSADIIFFVNLRPLKQKVQRFRAVSGFVLCQQIESNRRWNG